VDGLNKGLGVKGGKEGIRERRERDAVRQENMLEQERTPGREGGREGGRDPSAGARKGERKEGREEGRREGREGYLYACFLLFDAVESCRVL